MDILKYGSIWIVGFSLYLNIFYQIIRYKYENEFKQFVIFIVSLGISIGIITGVYGSALFLPLFAVVISSIVTKIIYNIKIY
ncbi:hypothetical protein ACN2CX_08440 [Aliarcobacter butzleri]|uniref:hypothetical protein n=1 Tax=Aliarcobacter butzleri TaxID=28197 RepID=UPI003AFA42A8